MIPNPLTFLGENRRETVFLPSVSFAYLYAEHTMSSALLRHCPVIGGGTTDFLWLAGVSAVVACLHYALADIGAGNVPDEFLYLVVIVQSVFLLISLVELFVFVEPGDIVIVSLFLLTFIIVMLTVCEQIVIKIA